MPAVKLRVTISIDVDAADYLEAAEHQRRIEGHFTRLQAIYPVAEMEAKERRGPRVSRPQTPRTLVVTTGRMHAYD